MDITIILIIVFIVIFIISSIFVLIREKKNINAKKTLVKNNQFVLENKDRIGRIIDNNVVEMKSLKTQMLFSFVIFFVAVSLIFLVEPVMIGIIASIISTIFLGSRLVKYNKINNEKYDEVVRETLRGFDSNLVYYPNNGFTEAEYKICLFPEQCDRFSSEDMIINSVNGFCYSDVLVESEYEDDDGDTCYSVEFRGSLARIPIKNMNCRIFLGGMKGNLLYRNNNYINIKFENDEFNELFRACADNELLAYKLLTPDVMEEFVNIKNNTYGDIDIRIIEDKLYIRFLTGDTFDSTIFNKEAEKENLFQSVAVLEEVMKTLDKVKNIIEKKNMD